MHPHDFDTILGRTQRRPVENTYSMLIRTVSGSRGHQGECGLQAVTQQQGWVPPGCPEVRRPEVRGQQAAPLRSGGISRQHKEQG